MHIRLPKKIRFLLEINTLYSYIFHRAIVKVRSLAKLRPLYPFEDSYKFDAQTQAILLEIQKAIPAEERGDNAAFNKNWKNIQEREDIARRVSASIKHIIGDVSLAAEPAGLSSIRDAGYAVLKNKKMNGAAVDELVSHLDKQKVYPSHVAHFATQKPAKKEVVKQKEPFELQYPELLATSFPVPGLSQAAKLPCCDYERITRGVRVDVLWNCNYF